MSVVPVYSDRYRDYPQIGDVFGNPERRIELLLFMQYLALSEECVHLGCRIADQARCLKRTRKASCAALPYDEVVQKIVAAPRVVNPGDLFHSGRE